MMAKNFEELVEGYSYANLVFPGCIIQEIYEGRISWVQGAFLAHVFNFTHFGKRLGCFASNAHLAKICCMEKEAFRKMLGEVKKRGYIKIGHKAGRRRIRTKWCKPSK